MSKIKNFRTQIILQIFICLPYSVLRQLQYWNQRHHKTAKMLVWHTGGQSTVTRLPQALAYRQFINVRLKPAESKICFWFGEFRSTFFKITTIRTPFIDLDLNFDLLDVISIVVSFPGGFGLLYKYELYTNNVASFLICDHLYIKLCFTRSRVILTLHEKFRTTFVSLLWACEIASLTFTPCSIWALQLAKASMSGVGKPRSKIILMPSVKKMWCFSKILKRTSSFPCRFSCWKQSSFWRCTFNWSHFLKGEGSLSNSKYGNSFLFCDLFRKCCCQLLSVCQRCLDSNNVCMVYNVHCFSKPPQN